ncbi:MAG: four helix bundle protein [Vicinamibacterales bacterium]
MAGARSFDQLDAWKLANGLKVGVYLLISRPAVERDAEFRNQLRNAAASAPRNIAEGFGRFQPGEFAQYLRVANGSLMETSNHLQDGKDRGYFSDDDIQPLLTLARRSSAATTRLIRYLRTPRAARAAARPPNP